MPARTHPQPVRELFFGSNGSDKRHPGGTVAYARSCRYKRRKSLQYFRIAADFPRRTILMSLIRYLKQLYFNGIIFILFIAGYFLYTILRIVRLLRKKVLLSLLLCILLVAGGLFFFYRYHFLPFGNDHTQVEIIIAPKTRLHDVATRLKQQHVIRSDKLLTAWMRYKKNERKIQSGIVFVHKGDGILRVSAALLNAKPVELTVMIPEGLTIEQTAVQIQHTLPIDTAEFIHLCNDPAFISSTGIQAASLEGYLFPNTYRFPEKVTCKDIIRRMVAKHNEIWAATEKDSAIAGKFTHHQLITLASIVEREATLISEQPHIAGVFHNRLSKGYPLGADPTVRFALKKFSGPLRVSELNSNSPYNTRKFPGLPPGPICSPGKGAIQAACAPLQTDDMYFVAKWDGSGEHDFSVTNAEHDRKKLEIRHRNKQRLSRKARSAH